LVLRRAIRRPLKERKVLSVFEATRVVKSLIERQLGGMWIAGEVSNLRRPTSGHVYFTLKDERSQLKAVLWRSAAKRAGFTLEDGLEVIIFGHMTVFGARGQYQIDVDAIEPRGIGAAQLALQQLKQRLHREGLFDPRRKRPLPRFPKAIAIVTSATGAAVRDMIEVIDRRYPCVKVILSPVRVQGNGAAREVERAIRQISQHGEACVILVGRGGGSKEDLWAFNDEGVARAIAAAPMPVISSVGHAIDTTIADLAADCRALTPTEAAELATPVLSQVLERLSTSRGRLQRALLRSVRGARQRLDLLERSYGFRAPQERLARARTRLVELGRALPQLTERHVSERRQRTAQLAHRLEALSPLKVLARGYSVTRRLGGPG
jgi:exodeoxyribonuclease VII large subunit